MLLNNSYRLCLVFFCIFLALAGFALYFLRGASPGSADQEARYYRAVYLLQSFGGYAAAEKENIPARVPYADETESLLHHSDKILVLRHVAEELAHVGAAMPRTALYEAYARLGLGERERAAQLLMQYVVESDYNAAHYALLCRILYELNDSPSLLMICREWSERDPDCRSERNQYSFAALFNLGRFSDAAQFMRRQTACLEWRAAPYIAKALAAAGHEKQAQTVLGEALSRHPEQEAQIRRLWEQLRDRERM